MTTASGNPRFRVVTQQDEGAPHISSVLLNAKEATRHLAYEAAMHKISGWTVTCQPETVVARRNGVVRVLSLRQSDAMNDNLEERN